MHSKYYATVFSTILCLLFSYSKYDVNILKVLCPPPDFPMDSQWHSPTDFHLSVVFSKRIVTFPARRPGAPCKLSVLSAI